MTCLGQARFKETAQKGYFRPFLPAPIKFEGVNFARKAHFLKEKKNYKMKKKRHKFSISGARIYRTAPSIFPPYHSARRLRLRRNLRSLLQLPMSKKRGLSLDEKRDKMLQIFYDSQDFFLLKELEKLGPRKGVISQSVKDVVQTLVDDDLVFKDKIGTSVYFWSLPSCAGNQLRSVYRKLEYDLQSGEKRLAELLDHCDALKKGREQSDEREEALSELKSTEVKYNELKEEMGQYADNDPAAFETMKKAVEVAHAAANRWTDNIFTVRQWCSNNFPEAKEQLEHMYKEIGITDDFDYLELPGIVSPCTVSDQILEGTPEGGNKVKEMLEF